MGRENTQQAREVSGREGERWSSAREAEQGRLTIHLIRVPLIGISESNWLSVLLNISQERFLDD